MYSKDSEIWEAVKKLAGETLYTIVEKEKNDILEVEDTGSNKDRIIIKDRETTPLKEDIIAAYRLLYQQGSLRRMSDLAWLAGPEKKTSSLVFTIISKIAEKEIKIQGIKDVKLVLIKKQ